MADTILQKLLEQLKAATTHTGVKAVFQDDSHSKLMEETGFRKPLNSAVTQCTRDPSVVECKSRAACISISDTSPIAASTTANKKGGAVRYDILKRLLYPNIYSDELVYVCKPCIYEVSPEAPWGCNHEP